MNLLKVELKKLNAALKTAYKNRIEKIEWNEKQI